MRVLVIGAGRGGASVIRQLQKNPNLSILTVDPRQEPYAVQQGAIERVDIQEVFTPLTLDYILEQAEPDLVLIATSTQDLGLGDAPGMDILAQSLREELAALSEAPVIEVARHIR
ncbi:MAG: Gfo/Idh/MocA family oxidoreductase [Anaerolineales bacterium]|jgi:dihydrodipicolinate reductase